MPKETATPKEFARYETPVMLFSDKQLPEYIPSDSLKQDQHLDRLITLLALRFKEGDQFKETAKIAYDYIEYNGGNEFNHPLSAETTSNFLQKARKDFNERLGKNKVEYRVDKITDGHKAQYRVFNTTGPDFLDPHIKPEALEELGINELVQGFENPATSYAFKVVATLKKAEAERQASLQPKKPAKPLTLRRNKAVAISA